MVEPFIVSYHSASYPGGDRARSINEPLPAVATNNQFGLAEPFLVEFHSNGQARSLDEPLPTITTKDRVGLAEPIILTGKDGKAYMLDIRFRMLQPHELAAAMSFPRDYEFAGNREEKVRQIGNAVPVNTAAALIGAMLAG